MKNFITLINVIVVIIIGLILSQNTKETTDASRSVKASEGNIISLESKGPALTAVFASSETDGTKIDAPVSNDLIDQKTKDFLVDISEARIMDMKEGELAEQRATSRALKNYGSLMVADQTEMLRGLNRIAKSKHIIISKSLGEEKAEGLADLKEEHGEDFDSKFIKMMIIDHKRDVKILEKATQSGDADIQVFATKYLPVIKSHLEKIQAIRKNN